MGGWGRREIPAQLNGGASVTVEKKEPVLTNALQKKEAAMTLGKGGGTATAPTVYINSQTSPPQEKKTASFY